MKKNNNSKQSNNVKSRNNTSTKNCNSCNNKVSNESKNKVSNIGFDDNDESRSFHLDENDDHSFELR